MLSYIYDDPELDCSRHSTIFSKDNCEIHEFV